MYHDKSFQLDTYFPMIAFNHEQLKGSSEGSKLFVDRSSFPQVSERIRRINPDVAGNIADRLAAGEHVKPETDAEKDCFTLLTDLDAVGARVPGSATGKRHMRNEIWSTSAFASAPSWFVTFAYNELSHPLCLYYAQTDTVYRPELRLSDERSRLIANNPVAAARFFHYMVQVFIDEILCWRREKPGVFGHTNAYYGTVEQQ
ncbi:hypothetical protein C8R46DRAFT_816360, partial [Mycena filopes]